VLPMCNSKNGCYLCCVAANISPAFTVKQWC
jgi:hypothetical protein